ncbi:AbrB/MazE/SpoVT family DNA-binding domain-containing protein [Brevibacillus laterosporus]|uniref:AbrB/MazE/SpoVT family DNA-binding domain-containing protein n=1 Tax=Brevibacillus laterosporus TaxID=1465 RepID=UPI002E2263CF|nr:AbrB/MazE/SpoVT family DNA-binding domain-containing protein [Brevibacillus laterosporus]MED1790303.1 AbrB/MazE/SpoVT family DNA-binding domain-containing protein [Brevibacillus laterosporus]
MKPLEEQRVITMKVQKWGNSLAIRIPISYANQLKIREGTNVELLLLEEEFLVRPIKQKATLEELLAGITCENKHDEIHFGKSEGNEIW